MTKKQSEEDVIYLDQVETIHKVNKNKRTEKISSSSTMNSAAKVFLIVSGIIGLLILLTCILCYGITLVPYLFAV